MTYGFAESTFETITVPDTEYLLIDDCTLAFFIGFRNKTLWHLIQNKGDQYKVFHIPKSNGKSRVIHAPSPLMKAFLHRLHARLLLPMQEGLGDHVTAYRPHRSIVDAVNRHIPECDVCDTAPKGKTPTKHTCPKQGAYMKMDLKDFFPTTRRAWIRNFFQSEGYSFHVSGLLANLMTVALTNPKGIEGEQYKGTPRQKFFQGAPQGAPTSGAICNLVANHRFDQKILEYFDQRNRAGGQKPPWDWRYSRYADDLTITCGQDVPVPEKKEIVQDLTKIVETSGYKINRSKTRITSAYYRRKMLGMVINQKPNIEYGEYLRIRAIVHNCMVNGIETQHARAGKDTPEELLQFLRGKVSFIQQVHPGKGDRLKAELDVAISNWDAHAK
jgi:hypothetical protein